MNTHNILTTIALAAFCLTTYASCNNSTNDSFVQTLAQMSGHDDDDLRDSQKWGKVVKKDFDIRDFKKIVASGNVDVYFTQGARYSIRAVANQKTMEALTVKKEGSTLMLRTKNERFQALPVAKIYVTAPSLTDINVTGAGDVKIKNGVRFANNLSLNVRGAGDVEINDLTCQGLNINLSGAGDIELKNVHANSANAVLTGAGDIDIKDMTLKENATFTLSGAGDLDAKVACSTLNVNVSGAGDADLNINTEKTVVTASGSGDVELKGRTHTLVKRQSGLSEIRSKKLSAKVVKLGR